MNVLDASALLIFLAGEPGIAQLPVATEDDPWVMSVVNWSEVCQKLAVRGVSWSDIRALPELLLLRIVPADQSQAEIAADLWGASPNLSLGDRFCLALGRSEAAEIWTADRAWARHPRVHLLR